MSGGDGMPAEMRRLLHKLGADPLALDDDSADRLLAGRLDPADAPPGYAEVAAVMAAATAPGSPHELAGATSVLEAFRAADPRPVPSRRAHMLVKLLTAKAAAAAVSAVLLAGGVAAAATGSLPDPAQRMAHRMVGAAPAPAADPSASEAHGSASAAKGPDATGPAMRGLCTAFLAGQGGANGGKNDSVAFKALADAAGGADKIAAFCKDVVHSSGGQSQGQSSASSTRGQSGDHTTAPGDHAGSGQPPADPGSQGQRDDHAPAPPTSSLPQH